MASEKDAEQQVKNKFNQAIDKLWQGLSGAVAGAKDIGQAVGEAWKRESEEREKAQRLASAAARMTLTGDQKLASKEAGQTLKNPLDSIIKAGYEQVHQLRVSPTVNKPDENPGQDQGYKGPGM